jgi:ribonuclease Z
MNLRLVGFFLVVGVATFSWLMTFGAWRYQEVAAGVVPIETRNFARPTLITVGTGGAYENPVRRGPATAVALGRSIVLVDAGRAVAEGLRNATISVAQPTAVLLTNLLPENVEGLDDLLLTGWMEGRETPLRLYGPPGTAALAAGLLAAHAEGIRGRIAALALPPAGAEFAVEEIGAGFTRDEDGMQISAGSLPGGPVPALAYRFEAAGRAVVISGTGWAPADLIAFATGAQTLIHEAAFIPDPEIADQIGLDVAPDLLRREIALHTRLRDVGGLAQQAGVERLILVRLRPPPVFDLQITSEIGESFPRTILIPDDGDEIPF